jgi:hypothetical protein
LQPGTCHASLFCAATTARRYLRRARRQPRAQEAVRGEAHCDAQPTEPAL